LDLKSILVVFLVVGVIIIAVQVQYYLKTRIDPRASFKNFLLFFFINLAALFSLIFLLGFLIIYFKDFFFKS